jgi:hypothetical protein
MKRLLTILVGALGLLASHPAFAQNTTQVNTELPAAAPLADSSANPTVPGVASYPMCWNGTTFSRCGTATAYQSVRITNGTGFVAEDSQAIFGGPTTWTAGTGPTGGFGYWCRVGAAAPSTTGVADDETVINWCDASGRAHMTGDASMSPLLVVGGVAHGSADGGNPLKVGGKADNSLVDNTPVTAGQRTDAIFDVDGPIITRPWAPLADLVQEQKTNTDGNATAFTAGLAAAGTGVRVYLTFCTLSNTSSTAVTVDLKDGTSGAIVWTGPVPANTGGAHVVFPTPLKFSTNTAVAFDASTATSTLTIACGGFKSKVG